MKTSNSRIALLTGASLSAIGLAMPAQAQLVTDPGVAHVVTDVNAVDVLQLCLIADDTNVDPECVYGQTNTGTGVVLANVIDTATGEISQVLTATGAPPAGGNVDGDIINGADTEIRARATATDAAAASATANIDQAILQSGTGAGSILLDVDNNALLTIIAAANATAPDADAVADINQAIVQSASSTGTGANAVTVTLTNDADLDVTGTATATGTNTADATSTVGEVFLGGAALSQLAISAGTGPVIARIDNNADIDLTSSAASTVTSPTGVANATGILNIGVLQYAVSEDGSALADLSSDGTGNIDLLATATASGAAADDAASATALAGIYAGIYQVADSGAAGSATANITNNDSINFDVVSAAANADVTSADGTILFALVQAASNDATGNATVTYAGTGDFTIDVEVDSVGDTADAVGTLGTGAAAVYQVAAATDGAALASFDSAGTDIDVDVVATGTAEANATGVITNGLVQVATSDTGNADAYVDNDDDFLVDNIVVANATAGPANADAIIGTAIAQAVTAGADDTATAEVNNDDFMIITADALANGLGFVVGEDFYAADATAEISSAIYQSAFTDGDTGTSQTLVTNNGSITVIADSDATATANAADPTSEANANAYSDVTGVLQETAGTATFISTNLPNTTTAVRNYTVTADARATGVENADASAFAIGVEQELEGLDGVAEFVNGGNYTVNAITFATPGTAGEGVGVSEALGYLATGEALLLDVDNGNEDSFIARVGNFTVRAESTSADLATASAIGMEFEAFIDSLEPSDEALLDGVVVNSDIITVVADADGGPVGDPAVPGSAATATGILFSSGVNDVELTNSGTLNVDAITDAGGTATATGILVVDNGTGIAPGEGDVMTITNSGTIRVRESINGGTSFRRGMAIDTALAPNPVNIFLLGTGTSLINGDIDISDDDTITVDNGRTTLQGTVNPECLPAAFETDATCGEGDLFITNDGELFLADAAPAPSYVFVDTFNMVDGSTLVLQLPDNDVGGTAAIGTYPQVFAEVANLNGNLLVSPTTTLFADSYTYNNVIDAVTRNGTFDVCGFDGTYSDSVLLDVNCVYETGNVDLTITRTAFGDVPGLTDNGVSVGEGLECIYDVDLTGGAAAIFEDLFTFNAADYALALNQLAGAAYAGYLQSFNSLGVRYNDILDHATSCEVPALAGSTLACRTAPVNVWAQVDFQNRKTDGDENFVGGYDSDRWTALVGADFAVGNTAVIGASIGRVTNRVDARQSNSLMKADGYQIGAYGVFDPGAFYVKAMGSYNWYDGDSERNINFVPFGGTVAGTLSGDPDVRMWTLGAHMGARFMMGSNSALTPFLNIDYTNVKLKGFTENGLDGPQLTLRSNSEDRTTVTGGVKWAADIGGVVPEATLGYRYQFGDRTSHFTAHFLDDGDEDCLFDIRSEREKRGSILGGLSLGGRAGPVDVRVAYQGVFNSQAVSHAGNFKIVLPFGGSRPAPAPVAYTPPPPPPAPVEVAPAPAYTPPPPPPPSSGERG